MTEAAQWRSDVGSVWAAEWRRTDRSFAGVSRALDAAILAAAPATGAVLDIGCGAGGTSIALATARPELTVTGLDLSPDLIAVAKDRGAGLANLDFQLADVTDAPAPIRSRAYDMAVSRHGVMFFPDPPAAFATIRALLAPGAPLVFSCFRSVADNPWANDVVEAITGAPMPPAGDIAGPFAFADPDHVAGLLARTGWRDARPHKLDYVYVAGEGVDPVDDALSFLGRIGPAGRAFATLAEGERPAARERLRAVLAPRRAGDAVTFPAAAWIWSAKA